MYATATQLTAVLYHIEHTQDTDIVTLIMAQPRVAAATFTRSQAQYLGMDTYNNIQVLHHSYFRASRQQGRVYIQYETNTRCNSVGTKDKSWGEGLELMVHKTKVVVLLKYMYGYRGKRKLHYNTMACTQSAKRSMKLSFKSSFLQRKSHHIACTCTRPHQLVT